MRSHLRFDTRMTVSGYERERAIEAARSLPFIPPPDIDLPPMQQFAIMTMYESQVKRAIVARLCAEVRNKPSWSDYRALLERGWANKRPNDSYHRLTFEGSRIAKELERKLCAEYGVHLMIEGSAGARDVNYRCTCGNWMIQSNKGDHTYRNAHASFSRHVATANGMRSLVNVLRPKMMERS